MAHVEIYAESIEQRNARVEADKAWEVSRSRRALIAVGTYCVIGGYLTFLGVENAWKHAFVPMAAYLLSTMSLKYAKILWIQYAYNKEEAQ